jgi:hypothetical protein
VRVRKLLQYQLPLLLLLLLLLLMMMMMVLPKWVLLLPLPPVEVLGHFMMHVGMQVRWRGAAPRSSLQHRHSPWQLTLTQRQLRRRDHSSSRSLKQQRSMGTWTVA